MQDFFAVDSHELDRPNNFTGLWEVFWTNGKPKYRGYFVEGVAVGQHIGFWEDGALAHVSWRDGKGHLRGTALSFHQDGDKDNEEIWSDERRRPGTFERRNFDQNGDVFLISKFEDFKEIAGWQRAEDACADEADSYIDSLIADAAKSINRLAQNDDINANDR